MSFIISDEYVKISIHIIRQIQDRVPFDIYVKRAEGKFTKLFHKNASIDHELLIRYQNDKSIQALYVHNQEHQTYRYYVEKILETALQDPRKVPPQRLPGVISEMASLAIAEIYMQTKVDAKSLSWAEKSIRGCMKTLADDPKSFIRIIEALRTHPHAMKHAIMVSVFSMMLVKAVGYESERTLMTVGLGGLVHDIGMSMLPHDIEFKDNISPQEWKEIKEHPQLGYQMLETVKTVSGEVRTIVLQHHERPNGCGYPNGFHGPQIFYLAKVVAIADAFSEKIVSREYRNEPMTVINALAVMREDTGHYDDKLFDAFSAIFGPAIASPAGG